MQTHHKHFAFMVVPWVGFTDGDWSSEEDSRHRDERHIPRGGGGRGILRIAQLPQNLCPQHHVSPYTYCCMERSWCLAKSPCLSASHRSRDTAQPLFCQHLSLPTPGCPYHATVVHHVTLLVLGDVVVIERCTEGRGLDMSGIFFATGQLHEKLLVTRSRSHP